MATTTKPASSSMESLVIENPEKLTMNYWSFTTTDRYFMCVMAMFIMTAATVYSRIAGLLVVFVTLGLLCRFESGRVYYTFGQWWHSAWIRWVRKGVIWEAQPANPRMEMLRKRRPPPIPFTTGEVGDRIGFIAHGDADVIVIEGSGSTQISESPMEQYLTSLRLAGVTKRVASSVMGFRVGVSYVFRRRQPDIRKIADNFGEILHPDIAVPEALLVPEEERTNEQRRKFSLHSLWQESLVTTAQYAGQTSMAMVITIQRESTMIPAVKGKGGISEEDVNRLAIKRIERAAIEGLRDCGVSDPHVLDLHELNLNVRRAWDVGNIDEYYERMQSQWGGPEELAESLFHWPQERILAHNDHCVIDGSYHTVLRVRGYPPRTTYDYFRQLPVSSDVPWLSVSLVGETVNSRGQLRFLKRFITLKDTWDDVRGTVRKSPDVQKRDNERIKREDDLFNSRYGQAYSILLAVSHWDKRELENDVTKLLEAVHLLGMSASRIHGACRQLPALWSVTTGIPML